MRIKEATGVTDIQVNVERGCCTCCVCLSMNNASTHIHTEHGDIYVVRSFMCLSVGDSEAFHLPEGDTPTPAEAERRE